MCVADYLSVKHKHSRPTVHSCYYDTVWFKHILFKRKGFGVAYDTVWIGEKYTGKYIRTIDIFNAR